MNEQPLGSDLTDPIEPDKPPGSFFSLRGLLLVAAIVIFLYATLVPNFLRARTRGQLTACKSNLKNLATALEMYASDNKGQYPISLDVLTSGNYLKLIPTCPSRSGWGHSTGHDYTYDVSARPAAFSMVCKGNHAEAYRGYDADSHGFPQYDSKQGLLDHP